MHIIQKKILNFLQKAKISNIGISQLGRFIDEKHPQQIKHHLEQLEKKGLVSWNQKTGAIRVIKPVNFVNSPMVILPIFGSASCGPAEMVAKENLEGFLKVSKSVLGDINTKGLFVVKACGDSLNNAKEILGGPIENDDYVVIDSKYKDFKDGDYVLSIIEDNANLKRFYKENGHVVLVSESKSTIPPIYINPNDFSDYIINGKIVRVFKKPKAKKAT
jgi:repressor LexA